NLDDTDIAPHKPTPLRDQQALTEIAQRRLQRALALDLQSEVALHRTARQEAEDAKAGQHEAPDDEGARLHHELGDRIDPQDAQAQHRHAEDVGKVPGTQADVEMEE